MYIHVFIKEKLAIPDLPLTIINYFGGFHYTFFYAYKSTINKNTINTRVNALILEIA